MLSKPPLPWSKHHPGYETSSRTGGILPTLKHRVSRLVFLPSDDKQSASSSVTAHYDTALANAVGNFHTAVNSMLSSRSSSVRGPPRSRPQSTAAPLVVQFLGEFPDLAMLEDRSQSSSSAPILPTPTAKATQNESRQLEMQPVYKEDALDASDRGASQVVSARSILGRGSSYSLRKRNDTNNASVANDTVQPKLPKMKRSSAFTAAPLLQKCLDSNATKSLAITMQTDVVQSDSKICDQEAGMPEDYMKPTSSQPNPTAIPSERTHKPESNIASRICITSKLRIQPDSSSEAHEFHVSTLKRWNSVQVASFETQARLFEERTNKHCLQNNGQQPSPQQPPIGPETKNLTSKAFGTPKLESRTQRLSSEPKFHEKDRAALQKQIDSLTAKLSSSSNNERELRNTLSVIKQENADKAMHANRFAESIQALNNIVTHLESHLEDANMKRLDAEEQLLAWRDHKSPFDFIFSKQRTSTDANQAALNIQISTGANTDYSRRGAYASGIGCLEKATPAALVARIEELQIQNLKKDVGISEVETELKLLQEKYCQLQHEHGGITVQLDLQHELFRETRVSDKLIQELRTAVIDHESTIMENEETIYALRRQLEHHKLLLQAEIRRHAATKLYVGMEEQSLPELTSLARREDIDSWVEKLHERLRREQSKNESKAVVDTPEATIESLHHEIDFYIREIIFFQLDIKGYRSNIRKLKEMVAQQDRSQKLPDVEPKASSSIAVVPPIESQFSPIAPELSDFLGVSPVIGHADTASRSAERSITTSPLARFFETAASRSSLNPQPNLSELMDGPNSSKEVVPTLSGSYGSSTAYISPESPFESLPEVDSVLSTASDYLAQSASLFKGTLGNTTAPAVPVKASVASPQRLTYIAPPVPMHVQGCSITRCALTDAVPLPFQPGTSSTIVSSTPTHSPVSQIKPSREVVHTEAGSPQNTTTMPPTLGIEAGVVPGHGQSWYLILPSMLSHLRRQSTGSVYSVNSCQKPVVETKSEASMRPGKI